MITRQFYAVLLGQTPIIQLSRRDAVEAVVADLFATNPQAPVVVHEVAIVDVSGEFTRISDDKCMEESGNPDCVE